MTDDDQDTQVIPQRDNRQTPRFPFRAVQYLAEIVGGQLPNPDAFERVQCVDISRSGFAFCRMTLPGSDELVIALGEPPDITYLRARVVQWRTVVRQGQELFRIGCQFTGRADLEDHSLVLKQQQDALSGILLMAGAEGVARSATQAML